MGFVWGGVCTGGASIGLYETFESHGLQRKGPVGAFITYPNGASTKTMSE